MAGLFRPGAWAGLLSLAAVLGSGIPGATLQADPGVPTKSAVRGFTDVDGKTYFAIGLRARQAQGRPTASRDQIVLVDTSASQIGEHRTAQLAVVEAFLNNLPSTDRVQLFATDVQTRPLTEGFVAVGSDELRQGLDRLRTTIPLGAGNFGGALSTAIESATDRPTHVTYVGDGMSAANIIPQAELKEMLAQFTARRIPVHTYAVGPQLDLPMLCAASAQTGGMFGRDLPGSNATADGTQLAVATTHAVVYPSSISSSLSMVNPQVAPLRTDRLTYFLATAETAPKSFSVEVTTDTGKQVETFTEIALEESNSYLASLSRRATLDSGLAAVIAGDRMLAEIQDEFVTDVAQLLQEGQNALDNRDFAQADQIAETVKRIDPASVPAKAIANASRQLRVTTIAAQQPGQENANGSLLDNLDVEAPTPGLAGQVAGDNQLIGEIESRRKVRAEQMRLEVSNAIESALQFALDSP